MRIHARHLPTVLLAVLFVLSACGKGGTTTAEQPAPPAQSTDDVAAPDPDTQSDPATAPKTDACKVITGAEAAKLAGTKLDAPVAGAEACTWTAPVTGPTAQVEVYVGDGAKKILDVEQQLGHTIVALSGIGDEAWLDTGTCEVFWQKSGQWVAIRLVRLNDPAENLKPMENLARTAASRQ